MPEEKETHDRWYLGYLICALCFGTMVWAFYPGMMSPDSIANLADGRSGSFSDINAPLMGYLWGWLDRTVAGPGLMFLLHNAIFWTAAAVFWKATFARSYLLGLALALFGLLPHILAQTPVIWKDVGMAASLFMGAGLVYYAKTTGSRIALLISPLFLFYGYAVRLNAFPAILPLAIWSAFIAFRIFEIKVRKMLPVMAGVGYFLLLSGVVYFVNDRVTGGRTVYPSQQIYLYDLAALSLAKGESLFPEYINGGDNFSLTRVQERYNTRSAADLIFPDVPQKGDMAVLKLTDRPEDIAELKGKWWSAVTDDPATYLMHRAKVFRQLTGLGYSVTAPYLEPGFSSSPAEFRPVENTGTWVLTKYFGAFRRPFPQTFFFRAFIWLLLCGFFLYRSIRRKLEGDWDVVFVLSVSSLLFTFAYFPTAPSTEFRYLLWAAIASAITTIFGVYLIRSEKTRGKGLRL